MMLLGSLVNMLAIFAGCFVGVTLGRFIPERFNSAIEKGIALCVFYIGLDGVLAGSDTLVAILSMVLGVILGELLDLAVDLDIIQKSGAWFNYGETRLGQGRDNVKKYLSENPEFFAEIEKQVRENKDKLMNKKKGGALKKESDAKAAIVPSSTPIDVEVDD